MRYFTVKEIASKLKGSQKVYSVIRRGEEGSFWIPTSSFSSHPSEAIRLAKKDNAETGPYWAKNNAAVALVELKIVVSKIEPGSL